MKSDDVTGRVRTYEAIVKGQNIPPPGVPESFKVLVKELQSLCLNVQVLDKDGNEIDLKETRTTIPSTWPAMDADARPTNAATMPMRMSCRCRPVVDDDEAP